MTSHLLVELCSLCLFHIWVKDLPFFLQGQFHPQNVSIYHLTVSSISPCLRHFLVIQNHFPQHVQISAGIKKRKKKKKKKKKASDIWSALTFCDRSIFSWGVFSKTPHLRAPSLHSTAPSAPSPQPLPSLRNKKKVVVILTRTTVTHTSAAGLRSNNGGQWPSHRSFPPNFVPAPGLQCHPHYDSGLSLLLPPLLSS